MEISSGIVMIPYIIVRCAELSLEKELISSIFLQFSHEFKVTHLVRPVKLVFNATMSRTNKYLDDLKHLINIFLIEASLMIAFGSIRVIL